ncbi:cellulose biosynthesis protein BcsS [Novosphingobium sp.]|uniref:cellulose biosynthesis protein BcsS n=1 Tax=Novosphingobium sp. TaxID=1874826 RepID=UPI002B4660EF|nr:cellulose biosynthesis protein BcsS [Novosphingobium sp.]HKR93166.1 cellulose biosynthesis protein BcsS [Novosphingobium sp.]
MITKTILAALAAGTCLASQNANADDLTGVWFVGGSIDQGQSAYGGAIVALPGARLGSGLALRASAVAGNYEYVTGGQKIEGDYTGGEVALVYQTSGHWGWASFSAGPRVTDTRLKPVDPGNKRLGTRVDAAFQTDGALDGRQWRASWQASYAVNDEAYQTQIRLAHKFGDGRYRLGVEGGVLGDPSFRKANGGLHAALPLTGRAEIQLGGGLTFQEGRNAKPYGSVGISSVF